MRPVKGFILGRPVSFWPTACFLRKKLHFHFISAIRFTSVFPHNFWYSTDGGNTFKYYSIVQHNPTGSADFRDPKIIWHEQTKKWVMLLAERDKVGFYTSSNLKDWEYTSSFVRQDIGIIEQI
ncbi:hypothetical protein [Paenibacillus sabinae]|uniref:hypothetical protein n=1 Tax=Paenibacillus sabinae TaxID=365617 RepID=UPI000A067892